PSSRVSKSRMSSTVRKRSARAGGVAGSASNCAISSRLVRTSIWPRAAWPYQAIVAQPASPGSHSNRSRNLSDEWYLDDNFWRNFGSLMFNADTFARGRQEVQQLLELLGDPPATVLDLGCGPGRHALPLADAGLKVTAVDTSPSLLQQLAAGRGQRDIELVEADMREFERPQAFDLIVVMWTSFGYFTAEADHRRVLDRIRASLAPGGRLILD